MAQIDFGSIIRRSRELTIKHKWLWIYGLALAAFGGNGSGLNFSSTSDLFNKLPQNSSPDLPTGLPEKTEAVLGTATTVFKQWFFSVPLSTWIILILSLIVLVLLGLLVAWIIRTWAKAALIAGLADADSGKPVTLASTSPSGLASIKHLILYGLIVSSIIWGFLLIFSLIGFTGYLALPTQARFVWVLLTLTIGPLIFLILIILSGFATIYAERLIVLHHYSPWAAWKKGLSLSRGNFLPTLVMGLVDRIVAFSVGCLGTLAALIVFGIPFFLLLFPSFKNGFHMPSIPVLVLLGLLLVLFVHLNLLLTAAITVFNFSNWNLFVKEILGQEAKL